MQQKPPPRLHTRQGGAPLSRHLEASGVFQVPLASKYWMVEKRATGGNLAPSPGAVKPCRVMTAGRLCLPPP
jgi:hypothetical protein